MKKITLIPYLLLISTFSFSQEFSFQLYFSDSAGNKDTITLGYDLNATSGIDLMFGETNIISTPLDTGLDVRISDEWANNFYNYLPGTYHTKKQIVYKSCGANPIISIDIFTNNWPVTATWDSTLFSANCRYGSVFTSFTPGGWWDVLSPSNLIWAILAEKNQVTFTTNDDGFNNDAYSFINSNLDTIPVFWVAMGDSSIIYPGINNIETLDNIKLFPNPSSDYIFYSLLNSKLVIENIQVVGILGNKINTRYDNNKIDVRTLQNGEYFVIFEFQKGQITRSKIIVNKR